MTDTPLPPGTVVRWRTTTALHTTGTIVAFVPAGMAVELPAQAYAPSVRKRTAHPRYLIEAVVAAGEEATYHTPAATQIEQQNRHLRATPLVGDGIDAALREHLMSDEDIEHLVLALAHARGKRGFTEADVMHLVAWARQMRLWNACINLTLGGEGVIDIKGVGEPTFLPIRWPVPTSTTIAESFAPPERRTRRR